MKKIIVLLTALTVLAINPMAMAWIDINDGESHIINDSTYYDDSIHLDDGVVNNPGTHVDVVDGGSAFMLTTYNNSTIAMTGGFLSNLFTFYNGTFTMTGGSVGGSTSAFDNSVITLAGGSIGGTLYVHENATTIISSGSIGWQLDASQNATVTMSGGTVSKNVYADDNATITISGGSVAEGLWAYENAVIYLDGTDFEIDGVPLVNGNKLSDFGTYIENGDWSNYTGTITGTLADGTALNNEFRIWNTGWWYEGTGDIIIIPEPCSLALLGLGGLVLRGRKA